MHLVLESLVVAVGAVAALGALSVGTMLRRLRRANRLIPQRRTTAPLAWRWSPARPAALHRRLRRSCQLVLATTGTPRRRRTGLLRRHPPTDSSVLGLAGSELLERAVAADAGLADLDRHGAAWRRHQLPALAAEVEAIESASIRLARLQHEVWGSSSVGPPDRQAEQMLDAFEAALAELRPSGRDLPASG